MYYLNDVVIVKTSEGKYVQATILQNADFSMDAMYWVKHHNSDRVTVVREEDLDDWNKPQECVCGAKSVNHPGHSTWCNYLDIQLSS